MTALRIVMPVLGEGASLAARLRALDGLRARGAGLVVVDGGSTDATWALAAQHADRVLLAPRGRGSQMNAGASGAVCDILLFLHGDTQLPPDADQLVASAVAAGAEWGRFVVRIDSRHPLLRIASFLINLRSRWSGIATGDQAIFVRRDVFEQLGGFPDIPLMEDIALSTRLRRLGRPACLRPPAITSARRWEKNGVVRTIVLMWRLRALYFLGTPPQALADLYGYARRPPPTGCAVAVAIMAKAPVAGLAKTRLAPLIGARAAARAQRRFTLQTVHLARQAALGPVRLWCAPDTRHVFFRALARRGDVEQLKQADGDLGDRLRRAMEQHFEPGTHGVQGAPGAQTPLLIIGTDCPLMAPGHLQQAARALDQHDVVLIPAIDGGYVLIGMRRPIPQAFESIAWSTSQVLQQTRDRLRASDASWIELEPLWDVDDPADWQRYQQLMAGQDAPTPTAHT
ncbi:MAG: TIGR04283 family arsenosugar biosynthesis glycosyltransferase [Ramlibacter sp.]|nr:TIGR04283 family arsenosugar biosynthesis glycosyltransferase [Ramlibacter sp.]